MICQWSREGEGGWEEDRERQSIGERGLWPYQVIKDKNKDNNKDKIKGYLWQRQRKRIVESTTHWDKSYTITVLSQSNDEQERRDKSQRTKTKKQNFWKYLKLIETNVIWYQATTEQSWGKTAKSWKGRTSDKGQRQRKRIYESM